MILSLVLATLAFYPVSIFGPLYLLNTIGISPLSVASPWPPGFFLYHANLTLSGRFADRLDPRWVAIFGLCIIFGCVLSLDSARAPLVWIVFVLCILGAGIGLFVPANEKAAFSAVPSGGYGMLSAMLTAFGTAAGVLGTTAAVALAEVAKKSRIGGDAAGFAYDQQFAFSLLLPLAALAVLLALVGKRQ